MMLEMVQDRTATGVTRVVCCCTAMWKHMEKLPHYYFSWIVSFQKQRYVYARCFFWRQNNPEVNYSPIRISGGGGGGFLGKISSSKRYNKKDYKEKRRNSTATRLERGM
jgi:hypothetical protein